MGRRQLGLGLAVLVAIATATGAWKVAQRRDIDTEVVVSSTREDRHYILDVPGFIPLRYFEGDSTYRITRGDARIDVQVSSDTGSPSFQYGGTKRILELQPSVDARVFRLPDDDQKACESSWDWTATWQFGQHSFTAIGCVALSDDALRELLSPLRASGGQLVRHRFRSPTSSRRLAGTRSLNIGTVHNGYLWVPHSIQTIRRYLPLSSSCTTGGLMRCSRLNR
jgi:hypothetical protein